MIRLPQAVVAGRRWPVAAFGRIISARTMQDHYILQDRYIARYNAMSRRRKRLNRDELEELRFNFGGAELHNLYWTSILPGGSNVPRGSRLAIELRRTFGSTTRATNALSHAAARLRGSGWVALVWSYDQHQPERGNLRVERAANHDIAAFYKGPMRLLDRKPLVVLDAWEHAWYLDHGPDKEAYVRTFRRVINWQRAAERLDAVLAPSAQLRLL